MILFSACRASGASPLPSPRPASPRSFHERSYCSVFWPPAPPTVMRLDSPSRPAPRLALAATTAFADSSLRVARRRSSREARSPQIRALGHKTFAFIALPPARHPYPVLVHRLAGFAPRFLPTLGHRRAVAFASFAMTSSERICTSKIAPMLAHQTRRAGHPALPMRRERGNVRACEGRQEA